MRHLGLGHKHRGLKILAIADDTTVTVIALTTAEILSTHTIEPTRPTGAERENPRPMAGLIR